jgi:hypothetical protein
MQLFHLTKSAVNQIAKTVQAKIKLGLKAGLKFDMPVLGLAGRHFGNGNWKIAGTFARHHGWVFVGPCHPCAHGPPANKSTFNKKFYICSDVTHTHLAYSEV